MKKLITLLLILIPCLVWGQGFYSGPYYNYLKQLAIGRNLSNPISANAYLQIGDVGVTPRASLYLYPTDTALVTSPQKGFILTQNSNGHTYGYDGTHWIDFGAQGNEQDPIALHKTVTLTNGTGISITGAAQEIEDNPSFTITNTAPDQVVSLTGTGTVSISGTYPNFTINGSAGSGADGNNYPTSLAFGTSTGVLTMGRSGLSDLTVNLDGRYLQSDIYVTAASFATGTGILSLTRNGAATVTVDLDGRYIENEADPVWSSVSNNYWTKTQLANGTAIVDWTSIVNEPPFLTTETDPTVPAHVKAITTTNISNWNTAYNDKINSAAFSGTTTKTLTLTQQDAGTVTANFTDNDTYTSAVSFATGTGVLTLTRSGAAALTVNLDGRYLSSLVLTGDVTGTNSGNSIATTIAPNAVTFAKMQDIPTATLVGRYLTGTGDPQSITIGSGLSLNTTTGVLTATGVGTESDPTVPSYVKAITSIQIANWDNSYNNMVTAIGFSGTGTKTLTLTQQDGGTLTANFTDQGITTETDPTVPAHVKAITTTNIANWNAAYNEKINSIAVTGTTTKTITLTQQDATTLTANFTDLGITTETDPTVTAYTKGLTSNTAVLNAILAVDGAGSTLDADLLDGQQGSYYLNFDNLTNKPGYIITEDRADANANTLAYGVHNIGGFFTNTTGSTNYPASGGGGIFYKRGDFTSGGAIGSFQIWSQAGATPDELQYKRLTAANTWSAWRSLWDETNHPAGIANNATFSGASVPASIVSNAAGHITAVTSRALTPGDIGAAPAANSGNYWWDQSATMQAATGWVAGPLRMGGSASTGEIRLVAGNGTNTGYIGFHRPDGTRNGYIGWGPTSITYQAENGATHEFFGGQVNINTQMNFDAGIRSTNLMGMMGDYDINSTASKIIWTIGPSWNTIATHYGLGYEYNDPPGTRAADHQVVVREAGVTHHRQYMGGGYLMDGNIQTNGQGRFKGWWSSANDPNSIGDGPAAEVGVSGGAAQFLGYDRTTSAYLPAAFTGSRAFLQGMSESTRIFSSNATNYTYGTFYVTGNRGGWSGIVFPDGTNVPTLMWNGTAGGFYQQANSLWTLYYDNTNWHINSTSANTVWHSGNHPAGNQLTVTAGPTEAIGSITTNAAGHVTQVMVKQLPNATTIESSVLTIASPFSFLGSPASVGGACAASPTPMNRVYAVRDPNSQTSVVTIEAAVRVNASSWTENTRVLIATLPLGYRPQSIINIPCDTWIFGADYCSGASLLSGNQSLQYLNVTISPNGNVYAHRQAHFVYITLTGTNQVVVPIHATYTIGPFF